MYISRKLKQTNIVEYVLYMWHIEEVIRSLNFDIHEIEHKVVVDFNLDNKRNKEMLAWYEGLMEKMTEQRIKTKGHMEELNEIMTELVYLHSSLLSVYQDKDYESLVASAQDDLEALKSKSGNSKKQDIELAMDALFGVLLLKLKRKKVSDATQEAVQSISKMMGHLGKQYFKMKAGELIAPDQK